MFARKVSKLLPLNFCKKRGLYLDGVEFTYKMNSMNEACTADDWAWRKPNECLGITSKSTNESTSGW